MAKRDVIKVNFCSVTLIMIKIIIIHYSPNNQNAHFTQTISNNLQSGTRLTFLDFFFYLYSIKFLERIPSRF